MPQKQTVMFRTVNGNVTVNEALKKPPQSKDFKAQIRFEPQDVDEYKDLCFEKNITFCDFIREAAELLKIYFDHRKILLTRSDEILPLLKIIRKKH